MGAVYRARDLRFKVVKPVAVKEIVNQVVDKSVHQKLVTNFEREANILATLRHSAIPKIHDYFTLDNRSYLVMEYIEGHSLESILDDIDGTLPLQKVVGWAIELCDVLHYLHTRKSEPIVFRDMKPANIMITLESHVVLVDFGIAKKFEAGQKGTMIGTEGYSPPEQYRGEATPQVDIYALGATLHHLFTGIDPRDEPPFTFAERPIRQYNHEVPIELENIVDTALQYNSGDRFKDAATMKEALILVARRLGAYITQDSTSALSQEYDITPLWKFKCEDEIRGSALYHEGIIYIGTYDNNLYALDAASGEFLWKHPTEGGIVTQPAYYAKGVYFGSEDQRVHVVSASVGRKTWTYYTDGPVRSSPLIRDRHVFIGSDDGHLHIINANSGRRALKINAGAPVRSTPIVTDEAIYFGTENGEIICTDFHGKIRWKTNAKRAITSSPKIEENVIYFGSVDGQLYAVDAKTGWVLWRFRMDRGTISTPWVTEKHVYIGSADSKIYCVNLKSGKEVWHFETEHQVSSSPIIYNDALYCGSADGNLYCLDHQSGQLRWKYQTEGPITGSPVIYDDIVYIGSTDHHFYALPA